MPFNSEQSSVTIYLNNRTRYPSKSTCYARFFLLISFGSKRHTITKLALSLRVEENEQKSSKVTRRGLKAIRLPGYSPKPVIEVLKDVSTQKVAPHLTIVLRHRSSSS